MGPFEIIRIHQLLRATQQHIQYCFKLKNSFILQFLSSITVLRGKALHLFLYEAIQVLNNDFIYSTEVAAKYLEKMATSSDYNRDGKLASCSSTQKVGNTVCFRNVYYLTGSSSSTELDNQPRHHRYSFVNNAWLLPQLLLMTEMSPLKV